MKKLMVLAAALCMSASAMAEWQLVEQTEDSFVFQEDALGVRMVVAKLAASSPDVPLDQVAAGIAKEKGCEAPQAVTFQNIPAQLLNCPNDTQAIVLDDGEDISMIAGACSTDEQCAAIGALVLKLTNKQ